MKIETLASNSIVIENDSDFPDEKNEMAIRIYDNGMGELDIIFNPDVKSPYRKGENFLIRVVTADKKKKHIFEVSRLMIARPDHPLKDQVEEF